MDRRKCFRCGKTFDYEMYRKCPHCRSSSSSEQPNMPYMQETFDPDPVSSSDASFSGGGGDFGGGGSSGGWDSGSDSGCGGSD